ncbi:MAG: acetyl/propionyl/methylcrotonyl-CoA carboxylase subunit alpha, partial [Alphaproteobacteria bacterium]|nr:acetyl/propionyl/methylcrotonyl-CoA carboxylase subunit alpha [Alphaproteobacteria bacterium]
ARLHAEADAIGYPVLIKAVAGGGGKGMRRVNASAEFDELLASCRREAAASFGDDSVLIEKYLDRPRHIEVQVFGDSHGNVVHLFERDCSLQRRHQKVIEEAPAPGMDEATRAAICDTAVRAARAVDYVGAGTVEFIADASAGLRADRIWFMEMNTRLQVEHPVTEEITGEDLVEWQLRVASGEPLPKSQDQLAITGWAIEARLYAEDPAHGFLPSTGRLDHFVLGSGVRVDSGVEEGGRISPYYDPMIAKLIARGSSRAEALGRLIPALEDAEIWPVKTNAGFLARAAADPDFAAGEIDTGFIPARLDRLVPDPYPSDAVWNLAAAAMLASDFGGASDTPWIALEGLRVNGAKEVSVTLSHGGETRTIDLTREDVFEGAATTHGADLVVFTDGQAFAFTLGGASRDAAGGSSDGSLVSPMPGRVIAVEVREGDAVTKGQKLVTLEAMKMEHSLVAPFDGIVIELRAADGAQVSEGALLVRIEKT